MHLRDTYNTQKLKFGHTALKLYNTPSISNSLNNCDRTIVTVSSTRWKMSLSSRCWEQGTQWNWHWQKVKVTASSKITFFLINKKQIFGVNSTRKAPHKPAMYSRPGKHIHWFIHMICVQPLVKLSSNCARQDTGINRAFYPWH